MTESSAFTADWVSPPGETIADILKERGMSFDQLADMIERDSDFTSALILGHVAITEATAVRLAESLGASRDFWLRRERQFRRQLKHLNSLSSREELSSWLGCIPTSEMTRLGWVVPSSDAAQAAIEYLQFFSVPSVSAWHAKYDSLLNEASFRRSPAFVAQPGAVSAWLRQGEIAASAIACNDWDAVRFKQTLTELRQLTREHAPEVFIPKLQQRCAACGVAVAIVRAPKGCPVSGAARFIAPGRPLIQLSFRHLSDDHLWFTFYHEAGHIVLHGENSVFLDNDVIDADSREDEANAFAAQILVPAEFQLELQSLPLDGLKIMRFARRLGIAPGIVVGQLQHQGRLRRNQLNNLKRRYSWLND